MKKEIKLINELSLLYPENKTELNYSSPFELLVATILSAQSTDKQINKITKDLFKKYKKPQDYLSVPLSELESDIFSSGFYKNKAKNLRSCMKTLIEKYNSQVPDKMEDLLTLPGVGRKTANIVLQFGFNKTEGIAVDTHVKRLSLRIGLTKNTHPDKIENDLMNLFPKKQWSKLNSLLVFHGRNICTAKNPKCESCKINNICNYYHSNIIKKV